jgi:DNA-binding Lrp family transcriptional regulator
MPPSRSTIGGLPDEVSPGLHLCTHNHEPNLHMAMMQLPPFERGTLPEPFDAADLKICEALRENGRMSGREIAERSSISEANVSRRLAKLVDDGAIRVLGFVPPPLMGLQAQGLLLLRCKGDPGPSAARLAADPNVHWCGTAFGAFDLVIYFAVPTARDVISLVDRTLAGDDNLRSVMIAPILDVWSPQDSNRTGPAVPKSHLPGVHTLDAIDRGMVRSLQRDGRASFADLADATGISATSAADRFRRLQTAGIIQIIALPDPLRLGNLVQGTACLRVHGSIRGVMEGVARLGKSGWILGAGGPFGVIADLFVRGEAELNAWRSAALLLPGVSGLEICLHRTIHRQDYAWDFVDAEPAAK